MKSSKAMTSLAILTVVAALVLPSVARADLVGAAGAVVGVEVNDDTSDNYATYQGRIFVKESPDSVQVYRWQGIACSGYVMNDRQIAMLTDSMLNKASRIIPYYKNGAGGARCIVSFGVTNSIKNVPLVTR